MGGLLGAAAAEVAAVGGRAQPWPEAAAAAGVKLQVEGD